MDTPRDDIDGLIERLNDRDTTYAYVTRQPWAPDYLLGRELLSEAATQLAALKKSNVSLEAQVDEALRSCLAERERAEALSARVKELDGLLNEWEDHTGPYLLDRAEQAEARATRLQQERDELQSRLPDGMKHCTITFHECEKGHGWLSATNWIDNGCPWCQRDEAYERAAKHFEDSEDLVWCSDEVADEIRQLAAGKD